MSKQIKIDDEVYSELTEAKWPGETYSHAIARLLEVRRLLLGLESKLDANVAVERAWDKHWHDKKFTS